MTNIFFIDEQNSSRYNGIGTFRDQLLPYLSQINECRLSLISLNSNVEDFCINQRSNYIEYSVPNINQGQWQQVGALICSVLRMYIEDDNHNVFIVNHSPCKELITSIRLTFPASKIIFVIHDQSWCAPLLGSRSLLERVVRDKSYNIKDDVTFTNGLRRSIAEERDVYTMVDAVVCLSKSTFDIAKNIYAVNPAKLWCIHNGYQSKLENIKLGTQDEVRGSLGLSLGEHILVFAGRPAKYKGVEPLMIAIAQLKNKYNIRCVFCGPISGFGSYSRMIEPIAANLTFTGQLTKAQLAQWYRAADFGVVPSYSEQFGYSAIEMVDYGLPLIVSDGNGFSDMFRNGENAFVASIGDVANPDNFGQSLCRKIEEALCTSDEDLAQMIGRAKMSIVEKYTASTMSDSYLKLCRRLTDI